MATDAAAPPVIELSPTPSTPAASPRRQYWQLPLFVIGLAAVIAAWNAFPSRPMDPGQSFERDLAALRTAIDKRPIDVAAISSAAKRVSTFADRYPEDTPHIYYLLGSANQLLAENVEPEAAAEKWEAANTAFARCDVRKLTDPLDQQRCIFRSAKAAAATSVGDARLLLTALSVVPPGEEPGERGRLLAETHLRTSPPDPKKARDELTTYLSGPNRAAPAALARYKLKLGELCLTLNEPEKARIWLMDVGTTAAPPDVQALAKVQLGRLAAGQNNWSEAVKLFEAAQATPGIPPADAAIIRYETGRGWMSLNDTKAAIPYFEHAEKAGGAIATAARLRLAEITVRDPALRGTRNRAADMISSTLHGLGSASEFRNPHVSLDELRAGFEEVIQVSLSENDFASAVRVATAYAPIAPPGRDRERRADANASWAAALDRVPDAVLARAKRQAAAEDFLAIAAEQTTPAAKADMYRRAAICLRKAGDNPAALNALEQILMLPGTAQDAIASAWLEKGDILLVGKRFPDATEAFKKAIPFGGAIGTIAQIKFARAHIDEGKRKLKEPRTLEEGKTLIDLGKQVLVQIANKAYDSMAEREAQQEALFELGKVFVHQSRNYVEAEARFRQLIQANPAGPYAEDAKLYLGTCLLLTARTENGRPAADGDRKLTEAHGLFLSLTDSKKPTIQTQADLRVVRSLFLLRRFDEMPELCGKLVEKYRGKVEELIVLSMLYWGYKHSDQMKRAELTFARMQEVYDRLPDNAFTGILDEYTRHYWEKGHVPPLTPKAKPVVLPAN